jgi:hypothetical protein
MEYMHQQGNGTGYCDMTPESRNSSLLGNGSANTFRGEPNERNNRRVDFYVVSATLVAKQRCGKHISVAVIQHATVEEAVLSMGAPQSYIARISGSSN